MRCKGDCQRGSFTPFVGKMSDRPPPYTYPFELMSLSERGAEVSLSPDAAERTRIAAWLDALEVPRFDATIRLVRSDDGVYRYDAEFSAEVVQACVVTLEPVPSQHRGAVTRRYRIVSKTLRRPLRDAEFDMADDDETIETLSSSLLDLAGPALEELSLMLDPYP